MAPNRGTGKAGAGRVSSTDRKAGIVSKSRVSKKIKPPIPKQQKTKSASSKLRHGGMKKKRRVYTDKELDLPKLNTITPVGVEAPRGKKRGKIFVDDAESMMTILAIVNADKEGQIESKMIKSRRMEEIRELRKAETEKREQMKKGKLEAKKDSMRKQRRKYDGTEPAVVDKAGDIKKGDIKPFKPRKRVSFS